MLIMFLDDDSFRHRWAVRELRERHPGADLVHCWTVDHAVRWLAWAAKEGIPFDVCYLDHDLGGGAYRDPSDPDTGSEVVRWVAANQPPVRRFVCHSMHEPAGNLMAEALRRAGYVAAYEPIYRLAGFGAVEVGGANRNESEGGAP